MSHASTVEDLTATSGTTVARAVGAGASISNSTAEDLLGRYRKACGGEEGGEEDEIDKMESSHSGDGLRLETLEYQSDALIARCFH